MGKKNIAYVNPQMLVWARSETPFRTTESVEIAFPAVTAKKLDAWEKGEDYPSITEAKKLALRSRTVCCYSTKPMTAHSFTNAPNANLPVEQRHIPVTAANRIL